MPDILEGLEKVLARGKDGALLRFSLGNEHLKRGDPAAAAAHLRRAVELDPKYSAAWKLLGKAYEAAGSFEAARSAWEEGSRVADANGDQQAGKEMAVFLKRLAKKI
ncbi:MAG: tetratricopeptide repeat protein [Burkholderiales bacterium]|nr:tetratricopeptide repeat protein [Burkholderiales bacterium]